MTIPVPPGAIADLGQLFPGFEAARPIDAGLIDAEPGFREQLVQHYEWVNRNYVHGAAARVVRLTDVYAVRRTLYMIEGETARAVYETARPTDRAANDYQPMTPADLRQTAHTVECVNPTLYLCSAGSSNYGHWLVDDLPRAKARSVIAAHTGSAAVDALTPGFGAELNAVRRRSLDRLQDDGVESVLHFIPDDQVLHFRELYYATPVSFHPALKSPDALRHVSRIGRDHAGNGPSRIYVVRGSAFGREIVNAAKVTDYFERIGFTTIDVDGMSFDEQVAAFADADVVAGCMGAAMTSTVFCKPGTHVLHLAPEGWMEPFYWDLADACQHTYAVAYGRPVDLGQESHRRAFTIETPALAALLSRLISS